VTRGAELRERVRAAAVAAEVREARLEIGGAPAPPRDLRIEPLGLRAPELGPPARGEPAGIAHVVGMKMRHKNPLHRAAAEMRREDALPQGARVVEAAARVEDGPARAVLEQPRVGGVEVDRQGPGAAGASARD